MFNMVNFKTIEGFSCTALSILDVPEIAISLRQPMSAIVLGASIFVLTFVPFVIAATAFGVVVFDFSDFITGRQLDSAPYLFIWQPSWTAFTMSLLIGAVFGLHRFGMLPFKETERFLGGLFEDDERIYSELISISDRQRAGLTIATWTGLFISTLTCWLLVIEPARDWGEVLLTPRLWFAITTFILFPLLTRAVALSAIEHFNLQHMFRSARLKNTFASKPMIVLVRIALRRLFFWMVLVSISMLSFVGSENVNFISLPWVAIATFMALWLFMSTIGVGSALMNRHKDEALMGIRQKISLLEARLAEHDSNAGILILAYCEMERRVERLSESSLEIPIALRALGYIFLPVLAWLCASLIDVAVVGLVVDASGTSAGK